MFWFYFILFAISGAVAWLTMLYLNIWRAAFTLRIADSTPVLVTLSWLIIIVGGGSLFRWYL